MRRRRILITGGCGFVGRHLAEILHRSGAQIFTLGFSPEGRGRKLPGGIQHVVCDLCDARQTENVIRSLRPDHIYHLAALSIPSRSWKAESRTMRVNAGGTVHLLEAIRRFSPQCRMLFTSSVLVYGSTLNQQSPVSESGALMPESPYACSKTAAELACMNYAAVHNLNVVIVRSVNSFGTGQSEDLVLSNWCRQVVEMEKGRCRQVLEVGNLEVERDFLYVTDTVRAYRLLMEKGMSGSVYNLASGNPRPLRRFIRALQSETGLDFRIQVCRERIRPSEPLRIELDTRRLRRLGWKPERDAIEAVRELLEEWRGKIRRSNG